jgi:hypothetical protein
MAISHDERLHARSNILIVNDSLILTHSSSSRYSPLALWYRNDIVKRHSEHGRKIQLRGPDDGWLRLTATLTNRGVVWPQSEQHRLREGVLRLTRRLTLGSPRTDNWRNANELSNDFTARLGTVGWALWYRQVSVPGRGTAAIITMPNSWAGVWKMENVRKKVKVHGRHRAPPTWSHHACSIEGDNAIQK